MTKFIDHRHLPIVYLLPDGTLLLPDEQDQIPPDAWPAIEKTLPGWDAELKIYNLTGVSGGDSKVLSPAQREAHLAAVSAALHDADNLKTNPL